MANISFNEHDRFNQWNTLPVSRSIPQRLATSFELDDDSVQFMAEAIDRVLDGLHQFGAYRAVSRYLTEPVAFDDRCDRWATIRVLERITDSSAPDACWPGWQPADRNVRRRPLRPLELCAVRVNAATRRTPQEKGISARIATIASLEAGAVGGELALIRPSDIVVDRGTPVGLHLPGTMRDNSSGFPIAVPRTVQIPLWARGAFEQLLQTADDDRSLLLRRSTTTTDPQKNESTLLMRVTKVLASSGLKGDTTVKPSSIRNGTARLTFERDGIQAATRQLGHPMEFVCREIGIAPQRPTRIR